MYHQRKGHEPIKLCIYRMVQAGERKLQKKKKKPRGMEAAQTNKKKKSQINFLVCFPQVFLH